MSSYPTSSHATLEKSSLKYAERGKPTFPCRSDKAPATPNGFKDASVDPERLAELWRKYPGQKMGMPTGGWSGVFVLDEDRIGAVDELPGQMPETLTVRTPRGRHYYLTHVEGITNRRGSLPGGIDVRGEGGYVMVPPSFGYEFENRAPVADAPEWLLDLIRTEPEREPRPGSSFGIADDGEPIPEGGRDEALTRVAGRLHDGTRDLARLEDDLQTVNEGRCLPPLPFGQVRKIARSVFRYEPCKPGGPTPETVAALARVEAVITSGEWKGKGGKTRRSIAVAWLKIAREHAYLDADGNPTLDVAYRPLALEAAVSRRTAMKQAREMDVFRVNGEGSQSGKSGKITFLLPPAPIFTTLPTEGVVESSRRGCEDSRAPFTASRLRWSSPPRKRGKRGVVSGTRRVRESVAAKARDAVERLGKSCEHAVDLTEAAGGVMRLAALAAALGVSRTRDLTRRRNPKTGKGRDGIVTKLVAVGVMEVSEAGDTATLATEWLDALNEERERSGEVALFRRDMAQYNRERDGYRNRSRGGAPADTHEVKPAADGYIGELHLVEEPDQHDPVISSLAEAVRDYLDKNPSDARRSPYWIGTTLWCYDLFDGKPTVEETVAAIEELGGAAYLEEILKRARGAA
jgi:Bifunctional DNA primase/polymerase, N-terminal/Primase C terminal 1 (PriCT-1)